MVSVLSKFLLIAFTKIANTLFVNYFMISVVGFNTICVTILKLKSHIVVVD